MNAKILFGFVLACFAIVAEVSGQKCSACGFGDGVDYCLSCNPYVVRPIPIPKPSKLPCGGKVFQPVGDSCSCGNIQVRPIPLPKPKYAVQQKKTKVCDCRPLVPAPAHLHDFGQEEEEYLVDGSVIQENTGCGSQKPLFPVDAVSIDLVNRMQKTAAMTVPEEKLQYGFWKLPKDIPTYRQTHDVPEEKLFTVERQIVELKHPRTLVSCGSGNDEEILLDDREAHPVAYLSYRDLGYVPESVSGQTFVSPCQDKSPCRKPAGCQQEYVVQKGCGCGAKKGAGSSGCGCGY